MAIPKPAAGMVLGGRYRLLRELGSGGMGMVFEAEHLRLGQRFAIKILQPELATEREFLMRFEREARAAALLQSAHIVRVYDVDTSPEGLTYMTMELLEGLDLADEADSGNLTPQALVDCIVQVCEALQEAHEKGIVHRDLKPANIFLAQTNGGESIAKVLDFGISKFDAGLTTALTRRDMGALGTPCYMAPEQIRGRKVDARADIWAIGVLLYRVLTNTWPFSGSSEQTYMASVLADPPTPFESVRPDLPYELAAVIMKALEKDPKDRFASANELGAALMPFGSGRLPVTNASGVSRVSSNRSSSRELPAPRVSQPQFAAVSQGAVRASQPMPLVKHPPASVAHAHAAPRQPGPPPQQHVPMAPSHAAPRPMVPSPRGGMMAAPVPEAFQHGPPALHAAPSQPQMQPGFRPKPNAPAVAAEVKSEPFFSPMRLIAVAFAVVIGFAGFVAITRPSAKPGPVPTGSSVVPVPVTSGVVPAASASASGTATDARPSPTGDPTPAASQRPKAP